MQVSHDGQIYDFPEGTSVQEMNEFLGISNNAAMQQSSMTKDAINKIMQETGGNRTPFDQIMDVVTGLGKAGQNIGDYVVENLFMQKPMLEQMAKALRAEGKEPNNFMKRQLGYNLPQVDIPQAFGTENGNPLIQGVAQYAPGALLGGRSAPGQILANSLYGMVQSTPEQENLFGILPEGRTGAAIEGAAMGALPFGIGKGFQLAKKGFNYIRPGKDSSKFLSDLSGQTRTREVNTINGEPNTSFANEPTTIQEPYLPTAEENIEDLARRLSFAKESSKQQALIPKEKLFKTESGKSVIPSQVTSKELLAEVSHIFGGGDQSQIRKLANALRSYYKDGDFDKFVKKGKDIFDVDDLPSKGIKGLEEAIEMQPLKKGKYLSRQEVDKNYKSIGLDELHANFKAKPTLENADTLRSNLVKQIRKLEEKIESKNYRGSDQLKLKRLKANEKALTADMESFFQSLPKEKQNLYLEFRTKWHENIPKYEESGKVIKQLSEGEPKGISRGDVSGVFSNPTAEVEAILGDIGKSGRGNVLYNEFAGIDPTDAKALGEAILKARQAGGYGQYLSEQDEAFAKELIKRAKYQGYAKKAGIGTAGLGGLGTYLYNR